MFGTIQTLKALADESRVRILMALRQGELCVCQITTLLGLAPSTISKHLSILRNAGLVDGRKSGRWMFFQLPQQSESGVKSLLHWLETELADKPEIVADSKRICTIEREGDTPKC